MANTKLDRIERDIEKTRAKILDYRFYAEDMVHPSEIAIRYIWERFIRSCISADALRIMEESENIRKMLSHKPFYPASEEYKRFFQDKLC